MQKGLLLRNGVVVFIMNAEDAFIGYPSPVFLFQKCFYTVVPDVLQVFDFAHTVTRTITFIQVLETVTGEIFAAETVFTGTLGACP